MICRQAIRASLCIIATALLVHVSLAAGTQPAKPPVRVGHIVGKGGSIFVSSNGGRSWMTQSISLPSLTSVEFVNNNTGFVTGLNDLILQSVDGGKTWARMSSKATRSFYDLTWFDSTTALFVGGRVVQSEKGEWQTAEIEKTTDVGASWKQCPTPVDALMFCVAAGSRTRAVAVGDSGIVLSTSDGGSTWQSHSSGSRNRLYAVDYYDSLTYVAVGASGTIVKSTDGGVTWSEQSCAAVEDLHGVVFSNSGTGIAVGNKGTIVRSLDAGGHWVSRNSGTDRDLLAADYFDDNVVMAVGDHGVMLRSVDAGYLWDNLDVFTTEALARISFVLKDH